MSVQDHVSSSMNESGTDQKIDTPLTQADSRNVLEKTRRDLIVMREAFGADSAIGHRCSNIVELLQMPELPRDLLKRQMTDLARLRAGLQ